MTPIDREAFLRLLGARFPEVVAEIDEFSEGRLHMEMATFAQSTSEAIASGDWETVRKHFRLVEEVLGDAHPELENAIYVSYLENALLDRQDPRVAQARRLLPPRLRKALAHLERYFRILRRAAQDD